MAQLIMVGIIGKLISTSNFETSQYWPPIGCNMPKYTNLIYFNLSDTRLTLVVLRTGKNNFLLGAQLGEKEFLQTSQVILC